MAISLKHDFVSAKADGSDSTKVQASNWNAEHNLLMASDRILGRVSPGSGDAEELTGDDLWDLLNIAAGTEMLFRQTTPPTGWSKSTSYNNRALRVTTGSVSDYNAGFGVSSVWQSSSWGTSSSTPGLPSHNHSDSASSGNSGSHTHAGTQRAAGSNADAGVARYTSNNASVTGSGGNHSHSISVTVNSNGTNSTHSHSVDRRINYVDIIIAVKD